MYLRFARRIKDGKEHRYWSIAESKRCAGGKVVQRPVLYLGKINDSQLAAWCRVIEALVVVCVPQFWPPQEMRLDWFGDRSRLTKMLQPQADPSSSGNCAQSSLCTGVFGIRSQFLPAGRLAPWRPHSCLILKSRYRDTFQEQTYWSAGLWKRLGK
jgi:hypothetical protein